MLIRLAIKYNVAPCFLTYIGYMEDMYGNKLHQFNIEDSQHPNYMSTIGVKYEITST